MQRAFILWLLFIPLGILNGALREMVWAPLLGPHALPLSGVVLCGLIIVTAIGTITWLRSRDLGFYIATGVFWVALTIAFEFSMGLFLQHKSFSDLLSAYDPTTGNLWLLVVIAIGVAPVLSAKLRHMI